MRAGRREPGLRPWAGLRRGPWSRPPGRPLCRGSGAALAALRPRRRHGLRWVSRLPFPEPAWATSRRGDQGGAERPGLRETPGCGGRGMLESWGFLGDPAPAPAAPLWGPWGPFHVQRQTAVKGRFPESREGACR